MRKPDPKTNGGGGFQGPMARPAGAVRPHETYPIMTPAIVKEAARSALAEDSPWGDLTSDAFLPQGAPARLGVKFKQDGVICGLALAEEVFRQVDPDCSWKASVADGERPPLGTIIATVQGEARRLFRGERIALNYLQRLSGVATATAALVEEAREGGKATIIDTRKTTPGLRALEKYAVTVGGGVNHRFGLSDGVLLKDNHLAVLARAGIPLKDALVNARRLVPHTVRMEVEVETVEAAREALAAGVDLLLLDNMSLEDMRKVVELAPAGVLTEASGNVTLERVRDISATGVDLISSGAITHSSPAIDISLDFEA